MSQGCCGPSEPLNTVSMSTLWRSTARARLFALTAPCCSVRCLLRWSLHHRNSPCCCVAPTDAESDRNCMVGNASMRRHKTALAVEVPRRRGGTHDSVTRLSELRGELVAPFRNADDLHLHRRPKLCNKAGCFEVVASDNDSPCSGWWLIGPPSGLKGALQTAECQLAQVVPNSPHILAHLLVARLHHHARPTRQCSTMAFALDSHPRIVALRGIAL